MAFCCFLVLVARIYGQLYQFDVIFIIAQCRGFCSEALNFDDFAWDAFFLKIFPLWILYGLLW